MNKFNWFGLDLKCWQHLFIFLTKVIPMELKVEIELKCVLLDGFEISPLGRL